MLCHSGNGTKRSPQKPPVHFTAPIGVFFILASWLLLMSVSPCALAGLNDK